ncbi:MAG: aldehyde dehydrogenase family protein [Moraxellaceae bacterium]|nr:aldehyde dehydrogenase family protein [Moraxellaceae bacterium]MDZ4386118.1 aldehyde dehydrogenase family protein [Moraxellaceae bacterium]
MTDIAAVFSEQRDTALLLRASTTAERKLKIERLRDALLAHKDDVIAAGWSDFRKPATEVELTEILPVVAEANDALRNLKSWMKPKGVWPSRMMVGTKGYIQYEPKGRCLIVSPWNYPVNLSLGPLISAIAAGNTAIIKPSEMTPAAAAVIGRIVAEVFGPEEVAVIEGDAQTAQALLELPFDHIFFTGSPAIGKVVMAAAAKHLTSVTLELGGKSPTIIDASANIELAAKNILWAKFTNNGQTCIAPDHIYVHADVHDAFVAACQQVLKNVYGDNAQQSEYLARMVNSRHAARVKSLLDDAVSRGAKVLAGGQTDAGDDYIAPTLLGSIPADATIMSEEIFGPLLPIIVYTDIQAVINQINADPKPLALYVWSKNEAVIDQVMRNTSSGGACINHCVVQFLHGNLPFGGVNNSGIGSAHGHFGFKAFSHERGIVRTRIMLAKMFFPPYTNLTRKLIAIFTKTV